MIKNFTVTATLMSYYVKEFTFDADNTECWYKYLPDNIGGNIKWEDLSDKDREKILDAYVEDLENESIDPDVDPDVYEETSYWDQDVIVSDV